MTPFILSDQIEAACAARNVTRGDFHSPTRGSPNARAARRDVAVALRTRHWSYTRIGMAIGRHYSTVIHMLRRDHSSIHNALKDVI